MKTECMFCGAETKDNNAVCRRKLVCRLKILVEERRYNKDVKAERRLTENGQTT